MGPRKASAFWGKCNFAFCTLHFIVPRRGRLVNLFAKATPNDSAQPKTPIPVFKVNFSRDVYFTLVKIKFLL